ncbi:MAG: stationary phase survival protein SurE [Bacteroidetes bacterium]|nr:stationary phase survival protein SurE [Bacteroidota bacterium]MBU1373029.1 stationary phase survival protein SurE [Bacteroidota bacterium]MBU1485472.1 stationary phase survival protein SurE [Bacteroidota bacterium]MBU1759834.1 stationary phase survival protein SurE [Bacteroidota bacterium]MBU2045119.1 stationary phase survival protein SurE [Bacteroidota bacterium]
MFKKDSVWLGLVAGLFFPAVAFFVVEIIKRNVIFLQKDDLLYIGCVAINMLLLKYAYKKDMELTAKGIISATFVCAFIFFYYKFNKG